MAESECGALVGPGERNPLQQQFDRQRAGLAVFGNGLDNVGRKIGRPQALGCFYAATGRARQILGLPR